MIKRLTQFGAVAALAIVNTLAAPAASAVAGGGSWCGNDCSNVQADCGTEGGNCYPNLCKGIDGEYYTHRIDCHGGAEE